MPIDVYDAAALMCITALSEKSIALGGMPEAVQIYVETHDIGKVISYQNNILEQYRLDIGKYSEGSDKLKIQAIFDSIPAQLNDKNRRFYVNSINKNAP